MNEQEYMEKLGQAHFTRDIPMKPLEGNITAEHPIPFLEMGSSFLIGLALGYFIKKSFKAVLFILGFSLIMMFFMESQGVFTINDKVLEQSIQSGAEYFDFLVASVKERITTFQTGVGAVAGFVVGLKFG
jgi:uncharacterized membrane protein (Fun14 family)